MQERGRSSQTDWLANDLLSAGYWFRQTLPPEHFSTVLSAASVFLFSAYSLRFSNVILLSFLDTLSGPPSQLFHIYFRPTTLFGVVCFLTHSFLFSTIPNMLSTLRTLRD